ncbi:MAG TPA: hypothetical protein VIH59_03680 [Candidatus Tectomicrobia bacterium]|jgi:hypothetical protein
MPILRERSSVTHAPPHCLPARLSRLWQRQGKRAEACEILAEVYGWFTEGFDTTDLQEAKALLDALA